MSGPPPEIAARHAAELNDYLPDLDDRRALVEVVANAIWCGDEVAAPLAEALLDVARSAAFAVHDAVERNEYESNRFRGWIADSLETLAEQLAAVERNTAIIAPGVGHA